MISGHQRLWKMPPLIKIYEALGAVADKRVILVGDHRATVCSSDGTKTYTVEIEGCVISSNDNGSYWQGYLGYPAIAVLLVMGTLHPDQPTAQALAAIPWKELNRKFHNDYTRTLAAVNQQIGSRGLDPLAVENTCRLLLDELNVLALIRGARRPPARSSTPRST
jgi:hypothetical protein